MCSTKNNKLTMSNKEQPRLNIKTDVYRVLRQVHPNTQMAESGVNIINDKLHILAVKFINAINNYQQNGNKINTNNITNIITIILGEQLGKHSIKEASTALEKYKKNTNTKGYGRVTIKEICALALRPSIVNNIFVNSATNNSLTMPKFTKEILIMITAVFEYIIAELMEQGGNETHNLKKNRVTAEHIDIAIKGDDELNNLFYN